MANGLAVYILESESAEDHFDGRSESDALARSLALLEIQFTQRKVVNRKNFQKATEECAEMAHGVGYPCSPSILHLAAHGSDAGIVLTSGEFIRWEELRDWLRPINIATTHALTLCMSSCKGFQAAKMVWSVAATWPPFKTLVGPIDDVTYSDTLVGFTAFYHHRAKGNSDTQAHRAMCMAAGEKFGMTTDKRSFDEYMRGLLAKRMINVGSAAMTLHEN